MPVRSTTRAGRFYERQRRYRNRLQRQRASYPSCSNRGTPFSVQDHPHGPDVYEGDGRKQQSLHQLIKNPHHGTMPEFPFAHPVVSHVGHAKPPHVARPHDDPPPPHHHTSTPIYNYHNRPQTYRGRKVGRLNGLQRRVAFADMNSYIYLLTYGVRAYPDTDPLHRTPTYSAVDFGWGHRVYGPHCA